MRDWRTGVLGVCPCVFVLCFFARAFRRRRLLSRRVMKYVLHSTRGVGEGGLGLDFLAVFVIFFSCFAVRAWRRRRQLREENKFAKIHQASCNLRWLISSLDSSVTCSLDNKEGFVHGTGAMQGVWYVIFFSAPATLKHTLCIFFFAAKPAKASLESKGRELVAQNLAFAFQLSLKGFNLDHV